MLFRSVSQSRYSPAANNFVSVIKGAAKDAVKVGALGAAGSAATSGIESAQGYKVDNWVDKMLESGGEFAKMDMLFKVLPILRTLPKAAQSAVKEFAVDPVIKPFVENYIKTLPEVQQLDIMKELKDYEDATKDIRGIVPQEKMASLGGRIQKRINRINGINIIKKDITELEAKKANLPEALHGEIDGVIKERKGQISDLEKEIDGIDKEIETINKSKGTGLEKEVDEATGEPIIPKEQPVSPLSGSALKDENKQNQRNPIIDSITDLDGSINKHFLREAVIKAPVLLSVNEKSIGESIGYLRKIANEVNDTELTDTVQYLEDAAKMVFAIKDLEGEKRNEFLSNSENFWGTKKPALERLKRLEDWSNVLKANTEKNKAERLLRDQYHQTLAEIKKRFVDDGQKPIRPK